MFTYLKRMDDGRPAILLDELEAKWRWTHGYVENVAAAIALAVTDERAAGRIYNIGEPLALTFEEWVRHIGEAAGWPGRVVIAPLGKLPESLIGGINAEQHIDVGTTRLRQELGYHESISLDEAIRRTVTWERANPPAKVDPEEFNYELEDRHLQELQS